MCKVVVGCNSSVNLIVESGGQLQMTLQKSNEAFQVIFSRYLDNNEYFPTKGEISQKFFKTGFGVLHSETYVSKHCGLCGRK